MKRNGQGRSLLGGGTGALAGLFWWGAYVPSAHSLPVLVLAHAAAGGIFALVVHSFFSRRWGASSIACGLALGLVFGPLLVVMPFAWGQLKGLTGFLGIALAMGIAALFGLESGRRGLVPIVAFAGASIGLVLLNGFLLEEREADSHFGAARRIEGFPDQPVAVIGIDGGDFSVIDPMLARGELPHLAGLIERGQRGIFQSIEPSLSPVVWTTIFSGHPAEVHGLKDWSTSDNRNRRVPMLWDIYGAHDLTSIVVNVPGSWPPAPVMGGRVISGFPIPGIVSGGRGQLKGTVLSSVPGDEGSVPTYSMVRSGPDSFTFDFPVAAPLVVPRISGLSHPLIDAATQDRLIPVANDRLAGRAVVRDGRVEIEGPAFAKPVVARVGEWSDWIRIGISGGSGYVRLHVFEANADRLRMVLTPAFQDPKSPRYPFAADVPADFFGDLGAPYVVEGPGWLAHEDSRVAPLLPSILEDVERIHAKAALALLKEETPDLLAYSITVTDRIQHPFWRDHEPAPYAPGFVPHAEMDPSDPVEAAYRVADSLLGEVLSALPEDALVFVVSDHGAMSGPESGEGEHRVEGIWIAAGPGVQPVAGKEMSETLSILDLVPTLLHCVGAPAAADMPGRVATFLCPGASEEERVASYRPDASAALDAAADQVIDATREEQLRSLGYIE